MPDFDVPVPFRLRTRAAPPPGWPPDVAPNQIITAAHMNLVRDSVYAWPGDVDGQFHTLRNVNLQNVMGVVVDPTTAEGDLIVRGDAGLESLAVGAEGSVLVVGSGFPLGVGWYKAPPTITSFNGRTGAVISQAGDYSAAEVTNAVDQTGSYANPAWITALAWSKITDAPAAGVSSVFGRMDAVAAQTGDYAASQVLNAVDSSVFYDDPPWLRALAWSKLIGVPGQFAPAPHTHPADQIVSGILSTARLGAGIADDTVFLRGDGVWAGVPSGGGGGAVTSVFGRVGVVVAETGDYAVAQVTGALADPTIVVGDLIVRASTGIARLPVGASGQMLQADATQPGGMRWQDITALAQTPWVTNIDAAGFRLDNTGGIGIGQVSVAGVALMTAPAAGWVGFGTSSPVASLDLVASSRQASDAAIGGSSFRIATGPANNDDALMFGVYAGNYSWIQAIKPGAVARHLSLNPNGGSVGIGNTATVLPAAVFPNTLLVGPTSPSITCGQLAVCGNASANSAPMGSIGFANYLLTASDKLVAEIVANLESSPDSGALLFNTWNAGVLGENMRLTANGRLGIRTGVPLAPLDVAAGSASVGDIPGGV